MTAGHVLAYLPSPPQGVWNLGPIPLRAYALCIIVGIVVAVWWSDRRWQARGGQPGDVLDVALIAVPFGLIGGRIYHVITDWWRYFGDDGKGLAAVFQVWDGGLGIWGAVAFGAVGGWVGCRWKRIKLPTFGDAIAPAILAAQAIGRLGNYFNQELYGEPTTVPWGMELYERVDPDTGRSGIAVIDGVSNGNVLEVVHPTFLYELVWNLLIVALLVVLDRRFQIGHGRLFALYVAGYCVGRFAIELMRSDEATHVLGLRVNVLVSALVFLGAALYVLMAPRGRETGLSMYWPDRAEDLAAEGHLGYVPPSIDDGYSGEDYGGEDYGGEDYSGEDYSDEDYSGEDYSGEDYSDEDYGGEDYSDEDYGDGDYGDEDYGDEDYGDEDSIAGEDVLPDDESTEESVGGAGIGGVALGAGALGGGAFAARSAADDDEPTDPADTDPSDTDPSGTAAPEIATTADADPGSAVTDQADGVDDGDAPDTDTAVADPDESDPADESEYDTVEDEQTDTEAPEAESAEPEATETGTPQDGPAETPTAAADATDPDDADPDDADPDDADPDDADPEADSNADSDSDTEATGVSADSERGYTVVSSLDGFDLDEISVVESTSGHDLGAMEIRSNEPENSGDEDD